MNIHTNAVDDINCAVSGIPVSVFAGARNLRGRQLDRLVRGGSVGDDRQSAGLPGRPRVAVRGAVRRSNGKSLFGKMSWRDDEPDNFACSGRLSPNMRLIARSDNVHPFLMWPLGPDRCRVVNYTLFPKQHFEQPGFDEKIGVYRDYLIDVVEEDREMVASLQQNMKSPRQRPGGMSKLELGIQHVINDVLDRVYENDDPV